GGGRQPGDRRPGGGRRRLDECPDYRPCNLPALERCDLIDDSPLLDGYR
ncbi:hypothetical protein I5F77_07955, partial [Pseudomonas aeruginosa]|nr:hypothetical protein [Pseudomonas aeruginosa]